jgi:glycerol dehydrogenase
MGSTLTDTGTAGHASAVVATGHACRVWGGPLRYVQGPGALHQIGSLAAAWGRKAILVVDAAVRSLVEPKTRESCDAAGVILTTLVFQGEVTAAEVARLKQAMPQDGADLVIAAGGGKGIDAGKALARSISTPVLTVPTAASTDAPTSAIFVMYDDAHRLLEVGRLPQNPVAVVVDTELIARAPAHLLVAGIGDALSKRFEVAACVAVGGRNVFGGLSPRAALALAEACDTLLLAHAAPAVAAVARGTPDEHLENLVEATVLLSGLCFESGGLSIAHALTRGLSCLPGAAEALHGLQVAWGLRVQWVLEERPQSFWAERDTFYRQLGLPMGLAALGVRQAPSQSDWEAVAERTVAAPHARNLPRVPTVSSLVAAMQEVERRAQL